MATMRIRLWLRSFMASQNVRERRRGVRRERPMLERLEDRLPLANGSYVVTQATDAGDPTVAGTMSWAIAQSNAWATDPANVNNTAAAIIFAIPNTSTIRVTGALPQIGAPVNVNGFSQQNTMEGVPAVELQGPGRGGMNFDGLSIAGGNVSINGLAIDNFNGNGISINDTGVTQGNGDLIAGCFIGTDLSGSNTAVGNVSNGIVGLTHNNS